MTETTHDNIPADETGFDRVLAFTIPGQDSRGRVVRLGPVLDTILGAHDYPPALSHTLAEALVLTTLMGSLLKDDGDQLTMQAQAKDGLVRLLVCDYRAGELRGYIECDPDAPNVTSANADLPSLFGAGHLAITFELARNGKRYQGIVPLEGESLAQAVESYFAQSEQVPTLVRTAIRIGKQGSIASGMLVQHLPEGEEGRERLHVRLDHPQWEHVSILSDTVSHAELVDPALSLEALVWRLFHEEEQVRITRGRQLARGCRCSVVHFEDVLARFPRDERREMANEDGVIVVDCAFCSKEFAIQD